MLGSLARFCSPFEFQDEYDKSQVDDVGVVDDLEWNKALDSIGLPRQALSPEGIAYRWNQKQEADRLAAGWCTYEKLWESNEEPLVSPQREETRALVLAEVRRFRSPH